MKPGDLGEIIRLLGAVYALEHGFDAIFEGYVAAPLVEFARAPSDRERLWIAEQKGHIAGCIAVVGSTPEMAQLRWFLVEPSAHRLRKQSRYVGR